MAFGGKNRYNQNSNSADENGSWDETTPDDEITPFKGKIKKNRIIDLESHSKTGPAPALLPKFFKSRAFIFPLAVILVIALGLAGIRIFKPELWNKIFTAPELTKDKDKDKEALKDKTKSSLPEIPPGNKDLDEGKEYYMKGWYPAAQSSFERVINSDAHDLQKAVALTYLGLIAHDSEQFVRAIDFFQRALKYNSKDPIIYRNLALAYRSRGMMNEAIKESLSALELEPENARNYQLLGNIYFEAKDYKNALETYQKGLKYSPDDALLHFNRGLVSYQLGDEPDAINSFHIAARKANLGKVAIQSYVNLGKIYFQRKDWGKAIENFQTAHRLNPKDGDILYHLGNAQLAAELKEDALKSFEQALNLGSDNPAIYEKLGDTYLKMDQIPAGIKAYEKAMADSKTNRIPLLAKLGELYYKGGNMEKAEEIQRKIIALAPGTNDARLAYIQLGNILDDIEHFDEAVEMYKKAGELDPTDDTAYINMGLSLKQAGKYNEARIAFQKAIKANPEKIKPRMALANLYYDQGFYDEALGEYVRILKARPDHAEAHFYLANLYHKRNQVNEAISGYREVIRLSPKDKDGEDMIFKSHLNLALLLAKMDTKSVEGLTDQDSQKIREKNFEDAITLAKKAIEMRAQDGHSYFVLGQIYFLRNEIDDTENAADMFRQTNITPGADKKLLSQGRNGLGKCYFRMGKYVEAIQEFTRALEYWPENEEATLNRKSASLRYEKELNR